MYFNDNLLRATPLHRANPRRVKQPGALQMWQIHATRVKSLLSLCGHKEYSGHDPLERDRYNAEVNRVKWMLRGAQGEKRKRDSTSAGPAPKKKKAGAQRKRGSASTAASALLALGQQ